MLLIRAIVAFLALPGVVAYAVPLWLGVSAGPASALCRDRHGRLLAVVNASNVLVGVTLSANGLTLLHPCGCGRPGGSARDRSAAVSGQAAQLAREMDYNWHS